MKTLFRVLFFVYLICVMVLCFGNFKGAPEVTLDLWGIPMDKVVHFAIFLPFPVLAFLAFDQFTETVPQTLLFVGITLVIGALMGWGTEWGQEHFTDTRQGDWMDFLADCVGLVVGSIGVAIWDIRKQKR